MKLPFLLFVFLSFFVTEAIVAQKILQIEKVGSLKNQRYYIGDEVIFQLAGETEDYWFRENIVDILVDAESVQFTNRVVKITSITKIRSFKDQGWSRNLSNSTFVFAGSFTVLSLIAAAATEFSLSAATIIIPGAVVVAGLVLRFIFRRKTYRIGKRRRLRVLDLNFYQVGP